MDAQHMTPALTFEPSANECFGVFDAGDARCESFSRLNAVVVGGGTGAPMSLRALTALGARASAVVAMADDGGSTGIICRQSGALAPGDIRKCLAALAADPSDPLVRAFSSRLDFAENHALGNLVLVALEETAQSFPQAIACCERLLNAQGHVYPCTLDRVCFCAQTTQGAVIRGQKASCMSDAPLRHVWLEPDDASFSAFEDALQAIAQADLVVLGPGSLFTSVISNLAVPGIADAIRQSPCRCVYVCPVADTQGETRGMNVADHVEAIERHGLAGALDAVIVNNREIVQPAASKEQGQLLKPVVLDDPQRALLEARGIACIDLPLCDDTRPTWHNPRALCRALAMELQTCLSRSM